MSEEKVQPGKHPNSLANLKKFGKGNQAAKGVHQKRKSYTDILKEIGYLKDVKHGKEYIERARALGLKLWEKALKGDLRAIEYIYNRVDGGIKTVQISNEIDVNGKGPLNISFGESKEDDEDNVEIG